MVFTNPQTHIPTIPHLPEVNNILLFLSIIPLLIFLDLPLMCVSFKQGVILFYVPLYFIRMNHAAGVLDMAFLVQYHVLSSNIMLMCVALVY